MCVVGCQKNIDTPESNLVEVGFSSNIPTISFDDEPLVQTRASYDEPKYLIQVRRSNGEPYAYGVLKDITNQKIMMEIGETYTMEVAYYPNGHSMRFYDAQNNEYTDGFVYSVGTSIRPNCSFRESQSQLYYLMGTLEGTGIRISELQYITVEAVKKQEADIYNKGKLRKIPIQDKVKKELLQYCKEQGITEGIIFKSRNNNPLDNAYIWKQLQKLAGQVRSGLKKSKVHPHSFRHLFAKEFISNGRKPNGTCRHFRTREPRNNPYIYNQKRSRTKGNT